MKKIVGILAAAAILATSAFAADISAGTRLEGSLFNFSGATEHVSALKIKNNNQGYHAPITLSISSDKAGATWQFSDTKTANNKADTWILASTSHSIWFKPFDDVKVTLGANGGVLNQETINYGGRLQQVGQYNSGFGYAVNYSANGFSLDVILNPGEDTYWASYDGIKETDVIAKYSADFGTVGAYLKADNNFKTLGIEAGYANKFGDVDMFADAAVYIADSEVTGFGFDADAKYAVDAINAQGYVKVLLPAKDIKKDNITVYFIGKVAYALDNGTAYVKFVDENILADTFACTAEVGYDSKVGIMDYEVAVNFNIAKKVTIDVPVWFKVNF